ncbi:MAG: thioredoxin domain-containing protein [Pseudomonadales bacterium]|jgi:uncharacterized protein YyaL (SSP411 family)|nr:thioredoxin domain-containing protein [Pseudomonadales bacterium]
MADASRHERLGNRLGDASSPYLLQHADNPVDWQPWDDAALAAARSRNQPILLSVGYASCHWCHVMAHESFEDPRTAESMNARFVNIKVDREERPDLDRVYQTAHQILTQQGGGWPLTQFLDPHSLRPFFSGTYFPRSARPGLPAFGDLLERVATVWEERREDLLAQGEKLQEIFDALNAQGSGQSQLPDAAVLDAARAQLASAYDRVDGGFGDAPKFPMPSQIERLLRHAARSTRLGQSDRDARDMALHTLTRMARGGIFDHLGGGFCRYATDRSWTVPHFEKMLYDNGALLALYADAMTIAPDALFETAVRETAGWLLREMQAPEGGFYAALDADSDGGEGRFYVWHREQIKGLLDAEEYRLIATLYGVDKPANFEGMWILCRRDAWRAVVERLELEPSRADELLASARRKLLAERATRPRPQRDDKILAAWNGLAIRGLARAARVLGNEDWADAATRAMDFVRTSMVHEGRLHAAWTGGTLGPTAFLEDHAALLEALIELLQLRWRDRDARFAVMLAEALCTRFADPEGGFFQTAHDAETLIYRPKPAMDEAIAAGNAMAARGLLRLGHLFGRTDWLEAASGTLRWAGAALARAPHAHCALLDALEDLLEPPTQILVSGPDAEAWVRPLRSGHHPERSLFVLPSERDEDLLLPPYLPEDAPTGTTAWICTGSACSLPITRPDALRGALGGAKVVSLVR